MNNNKKHIIKLRKIKTKKKISENTENEKLKNLTDKKNSEENIIKSTNEKYCGKISHLFEEHKFDKEVYEKYNNCSVKEILIKNDNNITDTNTKGLDSISPSKSTTSSTKSYGSKITYLTHSKFNNYKKSKYFNNDEYSLEMSDLNCRPAICGCVENMADYDAVFVGFPIWWGREPSAVDTFLTAYDFSGKKIIPFCTSGGSDIGKTAERIRSLVGDKACVDAGRRLGSKISESDLKIWTEGLQL